MPADEDQILFEHKVKRILSSRENLNSLCATIESEIKSAVVPLEERIRALELDSAVMSRVAKVVVPSILAIIGSLIYYVLTLKG